MLLLNHINVRFYLTIRFQLLQWPKSAESNVHYSYLNFFCKLHSIKTIFWWVWCRRVAYVACTWICMPWFSKLASCLNWYVFCPLLQVSEIPKLTSCCTEFIDSAEEILEKRWTRHFWQIIVLYLTCLRFLSSWTRMSLTLSTIHLLISTPRLV